MEALAETILKAAGGDAGYWLIIAYLFWERHQRTRADDSMKFKLWKALLQMHGAMDQMRTVLQHLRSSKD